MGESVSATWSDIWLRRLLTAHRAISPQGRSACDAINRVLLRRGSGRTGGDSKPGPRLSSRPSTAS